MNVFMYWSVYALKQRNKAENYVKFHSIINNPPKVVEKQAGTLLTKIYKWPAITWGKA